MCFLHSGSYPFRFCKCKLPNSQTNNTQTTKVPRQKHTNETTFLIFSLIFSLLFSLPSSFFFFISEDPFLQFLNQWKANNNNQDSHTLHQVFARILSLSYVCFNFSFLGFTHFLFSCLFFFPQSWFLFLGFFLGFVISSENFSGFHISSSVSTKLNGNGFIFIFLFLDNHGVQHVCHKCGWPYPNPHPSAKHRRAHKRICGKVEGYKLFDSEGSTHSTVSDDEHLSDDDHKSPGENSLLVSVFSFLLHYVLYIFFSKNIREKRILDFYVGS